MELALTVFTTKQ